MSCQSSPSNIDKHQRSLLLSTAFSNQCLQLSMDFLSLTLSIFREPLTPQDTRLLYCLIPLLMAREPIKCGIYLLCQRKWSRRAAAFVSNILMEWKILLYLINRCSDSDRFSVSNWSVYWLSHSSRYVLINHNLCPRWTCSLGNTLCTFLPFKSVVITS